MKVDQDLFTYSPYEILPLRSGKSIVEGMQKRTHGDFLKKAAVKKNSYPKEKKKKNKSYIK